MKLLFTIKHLLPRQRSHYERLLVLFAVFAFVAVTGCDRNSEDEFFQGYLEAEYQYVGSPFSGRLTELSVSRGEEVRPGDQLFVLDPEPEATARNEAKNRLAQAMAQLENLRKGKRPSEIAALQAQLDQARASLQLAAIELQRVEQLRQDNVVSVDQLDRAANTRDLYQAQVDQFTAELETARLGARPDEIRAAEAAVEAARASLERAEWNLSQKTQSATVTATVHDTLYVSGEWVAPGNPVVVLFPPGNLKVRFFVPQSRLNEMQPGSSVTINFDGAPQSYPGTISYVSTQAEFTPPVIYSQQTRDKLVFMIEARFDDGDLSALRPGQPVDVYPETEPAAP